MSDLDDFDRSILRILQKDARTPQREIGRAVNLSAPAVQRRIKRMEERGIIVATTAQVAPEAVGLPVTLIVEVELVSETLQDIDEMKNRLGSAPEVQQCFYVTGETDFIAVVIVESMAAYEEFTRRHFFERGNVKKFRTFVSMAAVRRGTQVKL